jgi:flagellin
MDPAMMLLASRHVLNALQSANTAMERAQGRLVSGLRVAQAKDNAAYWSISTAMRSDRRSLSAVQSALSLGAAVVGTAQLGLESAVPVLETFRAQLMTALRPGADPRAIQNDIEGLKLQLRTIAESSEFLGENWLSVNSGSSEFRASKSVLASLNRDQTGSVTLGTIEVDYETAALLDANVTGGGIFDKGASSNLAANGIAEASDTGVVAQSATGATVVYRPPIGSISGFDKLYYEMEYVRPNGAGYETYVTPHNSWPGVSLYGMSTVTIEQFKNLLGSALTDFATVTIAPDRVSLSIQSNLVGSMSRIAIRQVDVYDNNGGTRITPSPVEVVNRIAGTPGTDAVPFRAASVAFDFGGSFSLGVDDNLSFTIAADGRSAQSIKVDRALVDRVRPGQDGAIADGIAYRDILREALADAGVTNVAVEFTGGKITFASRATSGPTRIAITDVTATHESPVMAIDISNASDDQIRRSVRTVDRAIRAVTDAAAKLGAVAARIDMQIAFHRMLGDTMDRGISGLVDADMAEESSRLEALRVKQALAQRSLSITNSLLRNGLVLFMQPSR